MLTKCMYSYGATYDTAENRFLLILIIVIFRD